MVVAEIADVIRREWWVLGLAFVIYVLGNAVVMLDSSLRRIQTEARREVPR